MDLDKSNILQAQLETLESSSKAGSLELAVGLLAAGSLSAIAYFVGAPALFLGLPIAIALTCCLSWIFAQLFLKRRPPLGKAPQWQNLVIGLNLLVGLSWGSLIAATIVFSVPILTYAAIGGVVVTTVLKLGIFSGLPLAAPAYCLPAMLGVGLQLKPVDGQIAPAASLHVLLALIGIVATYFSAHKISRESKQRTIAEARVSELQALLDQRRTQVEKLNVALKTNEDKRQLVETNLRKASADLGLAAGKAQALATTLERVSPVCQVTGLANRRHFDDNLNSEWRRAMREEEPVSILIIGIDEYEAYIDYGGTQAAETLLKRVGQTLKGFGRRAGDMAGRYADHTLALLLPGCDSRNAQRMAEAVRKRVESSKIAHPGASSRSHLTAHVAVATTVPGRGLPVNELLQRAETALYEAQFQGGNKVVTYQPLSKLKLERWDTKADGKLNEQSLLQKLLVWGYDTTQRTLRPGEPRREHKSEKPTVIALLNAKIILELEGHNLALKAGDCVFVPKDILVHLTPAEKTPATIFLAVRSE